MTDGHDKMKPCVVHRKKSKLHDQFFASNSIVVFARPYGAILSRI